MPISFSEKIKSNFDNAKDKFFVFSRFFVLILKAIFGKKKKNKSIDNEDITAKIIIAQKFGNLSIKRCW